MPESVHAPEPLVNLVSTGGTKGHHFQPVDSARPESRTQAGNRTVLDRMLLKMNVDVFNAEELDVQLSSAKRQPSPRPRVAGG